MLSIIFALVGKYVDVATYSEYLTTRDYNDFKDLFEKLGLKDKIFYGTF